VAKQGVAWRPVPADAIGDPLARGRSLPAPLADRIEWLAGVEMDALGYERRARPGAAANRSVAHRARDARWVIGRAGYRLAGRARLVRS
jgi:hypothetical protein